MTPALWLLCALLAALTYILWVVGRALMTWLHTFVTLMQARNETLRLIRAELAHARKERQGG